MKERSIRFGTPATKIVVQAGYVLRVVTRLNALRDSVSRNMIAEAIKRTVNIFEDAFDREYQASSEDTEE
jgi:hypothetical protein